MRLADGMTPARLRQGGHTGDVAERNDEALPNVEVIDETDANESAGRERHNVHTWVRTVAAVVAAAGVLWGASALNASRAADEKIACMTELQMSTFLPGIGNDLNFDPNELREQVIQAAKECDLTYLGTAFDIAERGN